MFILRLHVVSTVFQRSKFTLQGLVNKDQYHVNDGPSEPTLAQHEGTVLWNLLQDLFIDGDPMSFQQIMDKYKLLKSESLRFFAN